MAKSGMDASAVVLNLHSVIERSQTRQMSTAWDMMNKGQRKFGRTEDIR